MAGVSGGLGVDDDPFSVVSLRNTTVGGNTPDNIYGSYNDLGGNTFYS